jgi:hypothetical protein
LISFTVCVDTSSSRDPDKLCGVDYSFLASASKIKTITGSNKNFNRYTPPLLFDGDNSCML